MLQYKMVKFMEKDILVHTCCGPCAVVFVDGIIKEGYKPFMLWYNPNIHPFTEYKSRKNALVDYSDLMGLEVEVHDYYGLRSFVTESISDLSNRCFNCYKNRLVFVANYAVEKGFEAFSTTLLASPYQNFDLICEEGKKLAQELGLNFIVKDYRKNFRDGMNKAREMGLYMQKYCGCIFSEEERYLKNGKR